MLHLVVLVLGCQINHFVAYNWIFLYTVCLIFSPYISAPHPCPSSCQTRLQSGTFSNLFISLVWLAACPTGRLATGKTPGSPDGQSAYESKLPSPFEHQCILNFNRYFSALMFSNIGKSNLSCSLRWVAVIVLNNDGILVCNVGEFDHQNKHHTVSPCKLLYFLLQLSITLFFKSLKTPLFNKVE